MKKTIAIILAVVMTVSCLIIPVSADAVTDKIDPAVLEQIKNGSFDGMVVEIRHHNPAYPTEGVSDQDAVYNDVAAQQALFRQIGEFSHYEVGTFSIGKVNVGLPYSSIEKVAALPNVDYIAMPEEGCYVPAEQKISDASKEKLAALNDSDTVDLVIWLAYTQQVYIGMDAPDDDATHETVDAYLRNKKDRRKAYITAKNEEFVKRISAAVDVEEITALNLTPIAFVRTTADKVMKIAALPEVWTLGVNDQADPVDPPMEETEPEDKPATVSEKFEQWMWDTVKAVREDDPDMIVRYDEKLDYRDYEELYTCGEWTLIQAHTCGMLEPWDMIFSIDFGSRILSWWTEGACLYPYALFVYDAAQDTFFPIEKVNPDDYAGILDAMDALKVGRPLGDADGDKDLTILDATAIQRDIAELSKLPQNDTYTLEVNAVPWPCYAYSDADRDGETTVMDATRIQRMIADLDDSGGNEVK